jgi:hypothetical protein
MWVSLCVFACLGKVVHTGQVGRLHWAPWVCAHTAPCASTQIVQSAWPDSMREVGQKHTYMYVYTVYMQCMYKVCINGV